MAEMDLTRDGAVFVLRMQSGENRLNPEFMQAFDAALDEVEASTGPAALVTTGVGKFYSNGLDLAAFNERGPEVGAVTIERLHAVFARLLEFPVPTVAAINGHAFAGGFMLSMAHDFRVMREDRGFLCLPEIDLKIAAGLSVPMEALLEARLQRAVLHEMLVTGKRYGGGDALKRGMVDSVAPESEVLSRAIALARSFADKDRPTLVALKRNVFGEAIAKIRAAG